MEHVHGDLSGVGLSQESLTSVQLSQDSVTSTNSQDLTSELFVSCSPDIPEGETADTSKSKNKSGKKKVRRKKKIKDGETEETLDGESNKCNKKSKSGKKKKKTSSDRPEPEGGNAPDYMDPYDRIIYSNEPIFSDVELSGEEQPAPARPPRSYSRPSRPGGVAIFCIPMGIQTNTMIKFAIIGTEIQNELRISLKRVGILVSFYKNVGMVPLVHDCCVL